MSNQASFKVQGLGYTFMRQSGCSVSASTATALGAVQAPEVFKLSAMQKSQVVTGINKLGIKTPVATIVDMSTVELEVNYRLMTPLGLSQSLDSQILTTASTFQQPMIAQATFAPGALTYVFNLGSNTLLAATTTNTGVATQDGKRLTYAAVAAAGTYQVVQSGTAPNLIATVTVNTADVPSSLVADVFITVVIATGSQSYIPFAGNNSVAYGEITLVGHFAAPDDCNSQIWFSIPRLSKTEVGIEMSDYQGSKLIQKYSALAPLDGGPMMLLWYTHNSANVVWPPTS